MTPRRPVVLCADDFGLSDGVSAAILDLGRQGRISATSAMTNLPGWVRGAGALRELSGGLGVGLHLNLTTGRPLGTMERFAPSDTFPPVGPVLRAALAGTLPRHEIRDEIGRQLDAFEAAFAAAPAFIDGHQHVHALRGVREVLMRVLGDRGLTGLWLRDPSDRVPAIVRRRVAVRKALVVKALASGFGQAAKKAGFAVNAGFSGFSPFDPGLEAGPVFEAALSDLGERPVVMCHPGRVDEELRTFDPVLVPRERELTYLGSDAFAELLGARGIRLVPDPRTPATI